MDLSKVFKGSLVKVIAELKPLVPKDQFESVVRKVIPEGLEGIEQFQQKTQKRNGVGEKVEVKKKQRIFDITKYRRRHIALRLYYDGSQMGGFALRDSCSYMEGMADDNSIEYSLFSALKKVNLVDDITKCNYNRCGRTDAGVSACNQVVSLYLRSNLRSGVEFVDEFDSSISYSPPADLSSKPTEEFDYPAVLNKVLPPSIRVTGWCPVNQHFSARHSCCGRVYRYYFLRRNYDLSAMKEGLQYFEGRHDFRNFCKIDAVNVCDFVRVIFKTNLVLVKKGEDENHDIYAAEIIGRAFLWHQIRCMMSVLFLVGSRHEVPTVIRDYLDVKQHPNKPQYVMADPEPLFLYDCVFKASHPVYYDIIANHPLHEVISEEDSKYNQLPCCFRGSLSNSALQGVEDYGEEAIYGSAIANTRYEELLHVIQEENVGREGIRRRESDFRELMRASYTCLEKRSKAPTYEERIQGMGDHALQKLKNRYKGMDMEKNEFIPDIIKEKVK